MARQNAEQQKTDFFKKCAEQYLYLTFGDITLKPNYSKILPKDANVSTKFSRNIDLLIPIVSAAMDKVTESKMARAMALNGGIGILHKNLSPEEQAKQVARVKLYQAAYIDSPQAIYATSTVQEVVEWKFNQDFEFDTFPVIKKNGTLIGVMTPNDFKRIDDRNSKIGKWMSKNPITSLEGTTSEEAYNLIRKKGINVLPIVDDENELLGMYIERDLMRTLFGIDTTRAFDPSYRPEDKTQMQFFNMDLEGRLKVGIAVGGKDSLERLERCVPLGVDVIVADSAHGGSKGIITLVKEIKKKYDIDVVAGNVVDAELASRLIKAGVDGIKVGVGPGSICTTRVQTGMGIPQISAVYEVARMAHKYKIPVCADGGITTAGDICKAIVVGADSVMIGNLLAGAYESPGKIITIDGKPFKEYRGMGSIGAMRDNAGSRERYFQENNAKLVAEGIEAAVPCTGPVVDSLNQFVGGLRNSMGYAGARTILEYQKNTRIGMQTQAGFTEARPHDVKQIKDAPNYKK